ncbi:MarR family transcriptional regulator [Vibrio alginolyticus]|nr:MarR family transcriptional regulator [Vibrio alginolyticus]
MTKITQQDETQTLDLDNYVPALVNSLANKLSSGASACYRKHFGIGVVEWRVLALLAVENSITANRICQVIGLDKSAVSKAVKQAEQKQWISLKKDAQDGRQSLISLTTAGQEIHDKVLQVALKREQILLNDFSDEEQRLLIKLMHKLNQAVPSVNEYEP